MIDLHIGDDVRALLGDEDLAMVTPTGLPTEPCFDCKKPFDDISVSVSMVVVTNGQIVHVVYAHAACAPSGVRPFPEGYEPPVADHRMTVAALLVDHGETSLPVLVCESVTKAYRVGEQSTDDLVTDFLLDQGFTRTGQLHQAPPNVDEWVCILLLDHAGLDTDGLFILDPHGGIFFQGTLVLPDGWMQEAARHGQAVLYCGDVGLPALGNDEARTAALAAAAKAGRVVGGSITIGTAPPQNPA